FFYKRVLRRDPAADGLQHKKRGLSPFFVLSTDPALGRRRRAWARRDARKPEWSGASGNRTARHLYGPRKGLRASYISTDNGQQRHEDGPPPARVERACTQPGAVRAGVRRAGVGVL